MSLSRCRSVVMLVAAGAMVLGPVGPANADPVTDLMEALADCDGRATVALTEDVDVMSRVATGCDVTLDLAGFSLETWGVDIGEGTTLTIDDSSPTAEGELVAEAAGVWGDAGIRTARATLVIENGAVTAVGAGGTLLSGGAGIGTEYASGGIGAGTVVINGGIVTAEGNNGGAGIGGSAREPGESVTINGGTVSATGSFGSAGIGGGAGAAGGTITINGGEVTAVTVPLSFNGRLAGASIGTGFGSRFGASDANVVIGPEATVTASGFVRSVSDEDRSGTWGSLQLDGTLIIAPVEVEPEALGFDVTTADVTIGSTGVLRGPEDEPTSAPHLWGTGTIDNGGAILTQNVDAGLTQNVDAGVTITGHHYRVDAGSESVTAYAPTLEAGARDEPTPPAPVGIDGFDGWLLDGQAFSEQSVLPGLSESGAPVVVELAAGPLIEGSATFATPGPLTLAAGESVDLDPVLTAWDETVVADPEWSVVVDDDDAAVADGLTLTGGAPGETTVTASTVVEGKTYSADLDVTVTTGVVAEAEMTYTGEAAEGETIELSVSGTDAGGNDLGDITEEFTFASDVATDVVEGARVTFGSASPHTITGTHASGFTVSLLIEVSADPVDQGGESGQSGQEVPASNVERAFGDRVLPAAGALAAEWMIPVGLVLVVAGVALLMRRRVSREV